MKFIINRYGLRQLLKWIQRGLVAVAILLFSYCGLVLADAWAFQKQYNRRLDLVLASGKAPGSAFSHAASISDSSSWPPVLPNGLIGRIDIPRIRLTAIVVEGTGHSALRRAVGHISGTPMPGEGGNVGISGHRDRFFRPLRHVKVTDVITLTTLMGEYRYRVVSIRIVSPADIEVLDQSDTEVLTLVTCYPFYFVGSGPDRFIVRAERIS